MSMSVSSPAPPSPSAVSTLITNSGAKSASEALALEIMHNLQHQHNWTGLKRHLVSVAAPSSGSSTPTTATGTSTGIVTVTVTVPVISGLPPQHSYIHPDLQAQLLKHGMSDAAVPVQREFVLPLSLAEKWSLARFCAVFDQLPERDVITVQATGSSSSSSSSSGSGSSAPSTAQRRPSANGQASAGPPPSNPAVYQHRDQKRVLLGMRAREGGGGDGTVVYYIMQEGEVKPRQNG
ncbi:hypothetical protein A1O3_09602 [Capronia epimyces CBS 606.96]|uniref:tRNA-splicing endonuclease subunit Sen15 domain-containing protein n=1 Tax=Capronia epimyces CBS 606.96 TaxID=1182542 RepID=W9XKB1_9EURO|nr:uncharacterized protein A1O3_09602 [Capronia epimyces CBS 606.96]EXJ77376.1 hypothetical protein A1O3_09602 [Capronia epimyces CBS 606.96]